MRSGFDGRLARRLACVLAVPLLAFSQAASAPPDTRLVEISVVVPVSGLTAHDFSISDNAIGRPIAVFGASRPVPVPAIPQGAFSNQVPGAAPMILLLDGSAAVPTLPAAPVAVYALRGNLRPVCDFHCDASSLATSSAISASSSAEVLTALVDIAGRVGGVSGRKSLIWISPRLPAGVDDLAKVLVPAEIAVYPVSPGRSDRPAVRLAQLTGGMAFAYADVAAAMARASADSAFSYTLGFYLPDREADGQFHSLHVKIHHHDAKAVAPSGYFAFTDTAAAIHSHTSALAQALLSPLEASGVPVQLSVHRVVADGVVLQGSVPTSDPVRLVLAQLDAHGLVRDRTSLPPADSFQRSVELVAGAIEIRLLAEDTRTEAVGSVIVPLAEVH